MRNIAIKVFFAATRVGEASARRGSMLALGAALSVLMSSAALAQLALPDSPTGTGNIATGRRSREAPQPAPIPAPDAVPGAKAREPAAPATQPAGDLQPTDALFDAINRGDIAAARDALSRGADLNGVNILGMTPMELSVDLGRNDISFLLLSMRGEDGGRGSRAVGRDTPAVAPVIKATRASRTAASRGPPGVAAMAPVAAKPVATPKLFAKDGGAPVPSAGFLGFDSRSASN